MAVHALSLGWRNTFSSLSQGVGGMLQTLHAKLNLKGLDDDQKVFYQSAIYAYEVNNHLIELVLVTGYIFDVQMFMQWQYSHQW